MVDSTGSVPSGLPDGAGAGEGPTQPLPSVAVRRWPRPVGFLFFLWMLATGSIVTVACALGGLLTMWAVPSMARLMPRVWSKTVLALGGVRLTTAFEAPLPDGPVVFIGNHQSIFDILALFAGLGGRRSFVFVAKKSVFSVPFLGWFIRAAGYVPVDRGDRESAIRSLEQAGRQVRSGTSVMVFAEGTRSPDGRVRPFKKGPFHVALQAQVPIVPLAIEGALYVSPKRRWYVCPNEIRVLVGAPMPVAGVTEAGRDGLIRAVRTQVIRLHRRLGGAGGDLEPAIAVSATRAVPESP